MVMNYLKMIIAQQAKLTHTYKNTKENLHRTNAAIWFNKLCTSYLLTPNYIEITINGYTKQCHNVMKNGVKLADTTTPHCLDGGMIYTTLEHPSLTQFSTNNFISTLYWNIF
jgi:hypothetical protein